MLFLLALCGTARSFIIKARKFIFTWVQKETRILTHTCAINIYIYKVTRVVHVFRVFPSPLASTWHVSAALPFPGELPAARCTLPQRGLGHAGVRRPRLRCVEQWTRGRGICRRHVGLALKNNQLKKKRKETTTITKDHRTF